MDSVIGPPEAAERKERSMLQGIRDRVPQRAGAIGWAFLVWLFGGGLGLAIIVFIVLKMLGG
jgi:hypothetical protein